MKRAAKHLVIWGIGAMLIVPVIAFGLLWYLEAQSEADGPGVGIGLAAIAAVALLVLLAGVALGTVILGVSAARRGQSWSAWRSAPVFYAGSAVSIGGLALAIALL
jgi:hypothetical protein